MTAKIEWYREVLELEPNSKVFFPLARLLEEDGQTDEAMTLLQRGVERHPEYLEARLFLIELLHKSDRREECNVQVGHLSKMFASYAGFWQAWAACLASEQGQADTASIIRFLAAHFVSGPLNLHEVLNRGLDSILGARQAAQIWNTPAKDQNAATARQMTAAAEFAAHSEEMLEDLDAELGTTELHATETLAEAAVDEVGEAEQAKGGDAEPELAVGEDIADEAILPSVGPESIHAEPESAMEATPAMAPELELSVAEALPVEEPAVAMAPSVSAEAAPETFMESTPAKAQEIAIEQEAATAPEQDAVDAGLAFGGANAVMEASPGEESAPTPEAGARPEDLAQPEEALEPPASVSELELSVADADALPVEEPLAAPEAVIAPAPDVAPAPEVVIAPEPAQEKEVDGVNACSVAEMLPAEDHGVSPAPEVAVDVAADIGPAPEVAGQELAIGDAGFAADMSPAEELRAGMPVAEPDIGAEAPDVAEPELAGGAADPVAEMLLAQDAEPGHEAAMAEPELALGKAEAAEALPVEEPVGQAEAGAMPESLVSVSEIAPESVAAPQAGGVSMPEAVLPEQADTGLGQQASDRATITAPETVAAPMPEAVSPLESGQAKPEVAQESALFHPAAFMATVPAAAPNPAQAAQVAAPVVASAEKAMQANTPVSANLQEPEPNGKSSLRDDFVEEEPFSLRTRSMAEVLAEQGDIQGALDIYQELAAAATSADEVEDINRRIATLSGRLKVATASAAFKVEEEEAAARSKAKLLGMLEALEEGMRARAQA